MKKFSIVIICALCITACGLKTSEADLDHKLITEEPIFESENSISESSMDETEENNEDDTSEEDTSEENTTEGDILDPDEVVSASDQEVKTEIEIFEENAEDILAEMSLEEKVYQMFIITPEQLTGVGTVTTAGNTTKDRLQKYPVGGLIYFASNLLDSSQTSKMLSSTQEFALEIEGLPLFLCIDEEGGRVARIANNAAFGIEKIKPMRDVKSAEEAYEIGSTIGE